MSSKPMPKVVFTAFWTVLLLLAAVPGAHATASDDQTVGMVNGQPITAKQLDLEISRLRQRTPAGQNPSDMPSPDLREKALDALIERQLLRQQAEKEDIKIDEQRVDEKISAIKKRYPDPKQYDQILANMNITEADLKGHIREGLVLQTLIDRVIVANITISDDQVKQFYDNHPDLFQQQQQVRASHILIKLAPDADEAAKKAAMEKVVQVQKRLKDGEDFATVAKELSEGPSAGNGGDLGFFDKGKMVKPFEDAVFTMKVGDVSDTVQTQFGYHIIKVTGEKPARKLPYDEVKADIAGHLKNNQVKTDLDAYIEKLKGSAQIEKK